MSTGGGVEAGNGESEGPLDAGNTESDDKTTGRADAPERGESGEAGGSAGGRRNHGSTDDRDAGADDDGVCANELLELLGNRRRRLLWRHLRTEAAEAALSDASRQIAAWENGVDPGDVDYDQRKSVYTSLRQFHCPKMADAGLVEFDDRDGTVRLTSDLPDELVIEIEPDTANVERTALGTLGTAAGVVLGAWALGLPVFGPLSFAGVAFAVAFAAVAAGVVYAVAVRSEHGVSLGDALARVDG